MIGKEIWKIETGCDKIKKLIKNHMHVQSGFEIYHKITICDHIHMAWVTYVGKYQKAYINKMKDC